MRRGDVATTSAVAPSARSSTTTARVTARCEAPGRGEAVDPVHEVVEVDAPDGAEHRQHAPRDAERVDRGAHGERRKAAEPGHGPDGGDELGDRPKAGGDGDVIVPPADRRDD